MDILEQLETPLSSLDRLILATRLTIHLCTFDDHELAERAVRKFKEFDDEWFFELRLRLSFRYGIQQVEIYNDLVSRDDIRLAEDADIYAILSYCRASHRVEPSVGPMRRAIELIIDLDRNPDELQILKLRLISLTFPVFFAFTTVADTIQIFGDPEIARSLREDIGLLHSLGAEMKVIIGVEN